MSYSQLFPFVTQSERCICQAREGAFRFESDLTLKSDLTSKLSCASPSRPGVTVVTSNDSIRVKLSCSFLTSVAKGETTSADVGFTSKHGASSCKRSKRRRSMSTVTCQGTQTQRMVTVNLPCDDFVVANSSSASTRPLCSSSKLDTVV